MLITAKGIELKGLSRNITRVLKIIEQIFFDQQQALVIIGSKWGHDHSRFAHESGKAIDICPPATNRDLVKTRLRFCLGLNYIVRDHQSHLHIEHWPPPRLRETGGRT